jgi:hypothetical protein
MNDGNEIRDRVPVARRAAAPRRDKVTRRVEYRSVIPCLANPRWEQPVFSVAGDDYSWLDVFLAAMLCGEWRAFEIRLVECLACLGEATAEQLWPDTDRIEAAATAFRYDRDLLTSEATVAWLKHAGLTLEDWTSFLVGRLLVDEWSDRLASVVDRHAPSLVITDRVFVAEAVCSGIFDASARALAGRAAVAATANVELENAIVDEGRLEEVRKIHAAWLEPIEPSVLSDRLTHLTRLDSMFDAQVRARTTPEALAVQLSRHRLEWMRVDLEHLSFASADEAREAAWCVLEDGRTLDEISVDLGLAVRDSRELLERLEPELRDAVLGANVHQLIGPLKMGDRHEVIWVVGKVGPDLADPLVSARAVKAAIEQLVAPAIRAHVRWADRPQI